MKGSIHKVPGIDNRGRKNYSFRVMYTIIDPTSGERKRTSKRGFKTKREAQTFLSLIEDENEKINQYTEGSYQTLSCYLKFWLDTVVTNKVKRTTASDYKRIVNTYILPYAGKILLKDISGVTLDSMFDSLKIYGNSNPAKELSPRTLLYIRRILHKAFKDAIKRGYIDKNPCDYMLFEIKADRFEPETYNKEELVNLLNLSKNSSMAIPIALAAFCGLRRGEVLAVTPNDVNYDEQTISITKQIVEIDGKVQYASPKTERSKRMVFMPGFLAVMIKKQIALIQKLYGESESVINTSPILRNSKGGAIKPKNLSNGFSRFLKRHGLRHIRYHDLRHSFASLLYKEGIPLKTASELLGHSTIEITADIYTHLSQKEKNRAAEQLCNSIFIDKQSINF